MGCTLRSLFFWISVIYDFFGRPNLCTGTSNPLDTALDASGRTRGKSFSASVNASLSSSHLKTGIRRIMPGEAPYALIHLQRRTKAFTACGRIMRLNV